MRYKKCCDFSCLKGGCEVCELGGCLCVCKLTDRLKTLDDCIAGLNFGYGSLYIPCSERSIDYLKNLSSEQRKREEDWRLRGAPLERQLVLAKLKEYEIESVEIT